MYVVKTNKGKSQCRPGRFPGRQDFFVGIFVFKSWGIHWSQGYFLRSPNLGGHPKIPLTQAQEMMQKMRLFIKYLVVKMQGNQKSPSKFLKVGHETSWWLQIFYFHPDFWENSWSNLTNSYFPNGRKVGQICRKNSHPFLNLGQRDCSLRVLRNWPNVVSTVAELRGWCRQFFEGDHKLWPMESPVKRLSLPPKKTSR